MKKLNLNKQKLSNLFYGLIKILVHLTVLSISALLTISMFRSFSSVPLYKTLWTVLGMAIECGKIYLWVLAVALFRRNESNDRGISAVIFLVYLGLAVVSFIANSGFALQSVQEQSFTAEVKNQATSTILIDREIEQLESDIEFLEQNRTLAQEKKKALPDNWSTKEQDLIIDQANLDINTKNNRITELLIERQTQLNESTENGAEAREAKASDVFSLLGGAKLTGDQVMLYIMRLLAVLLECLTIITAGKLQLRTRVVESKETLAESTENEATKPLIQVVEDEVKEDVIPVQTEVHVKSDNTAFETYIKSLLANGKEKLRTDNEISEETGIALSHCKSFRRTLSSMTYNGESLIEGKRGVGSWSNYPARTLIKLVKMNRKIK